MLRTRILIGLTILATCSSTLAQDENDDLTLSSLAELGSIIESDDSDSQPVAESQPDGEQIQQRFSNGRVQIERWVVESKSGDYVNNGRFTEYNPQGEIIVAGQYAMGRRDGSWNRRLSAELARRLSNTLDGGFSAPFTSKATFTQDRLNGDWTCSDAKGNLVFVWSFKDGQQDGLSTWFNSKGAVIQSITYAKNLAHGPAKLASKSEAALQDIQFENGRYQRKTDNWFPASRNAKRRLKTQEAHLAPGRFNVVSHDWVASSVQYRKYAKTDVIRHGRTIAFHPNGQRESEAHYDHGQRIGTSVWWYPNGQQKTVGEYENDKEDGKFTWWHSNGMKQASGQFSEGVRVGQWSSWGSDGKLVKRADAEQTRVAGRKVRQK